MSVQAVETDYLLVFDSIFEHGLLPQTVLALKGSWRSVIRYP